MDLLNWKPVAVRVAVGLVLGLVGAVAHHAWIALWSAFVLSFGFGLSSYRDGENKNAVLVDMGLVLGGVLAGVLLYHLF